MPDLFCSECHREIREGIETPYDVVYDKPDPKRPAFLGKKIISALCPDCGELKRKDKAAFKKQAKANKAPDPEDIKARAKASLKRSAKAEPKPQAKAKSLSKQQPDGSKKGSTPPSAKAAVLGLFKQHPKKKFTTGGIYNALRDSGNKVAMSDLRPVVKKLLKKGELKKHGKEIGL